MAGILGGAALFFNPHSPSANPVFYDDVYYGYIPTNPAPDFSLPKDILDLTPQEQQQLILDFCQEQRDAMAQDEDRRLTGRYWKDNHHKRMIVAQERGDEYLAETITKRDTADDTTYAKGSFPTNVNTGPARTTMLGMLLAVLFTIPSDVKQALLRGDFSALLMDQATGRPLRHQVTATPNPSSDKLPERLWKPHLYVLHLIDPYLRNPSMPDMRRMLQRAREYVADVAEVPGGSPMRQIIFRNGPRTLAELQTVIDVDNFRNMGRGLHADVLTSARYRTAVANGTTHIRCRYIANNRQLKVINNMIEVMQRWLDKLVTDGWPPQSPNPLPYTAASAGWTADAAFRRWGYTHHDVSGNIVLFEAIAFSLLLGCFSWKCVFQIWDKRLVPMAEHVAHVLGGTYVNQGGLNSTAAGISVKSLNKIPIPTYQLVEHRLLNSAHWTPNVAAVKTRNTKILDSLAALPEYFQLKRATRDQNQREDESLARLEQAQTEQAAKEKAEREALNTRVDCTSHLLEDMGILDEQYETLKKIHDAIYSTPGLKAHVAAVVGKPTYISEEISQSSQFTPETLEKLKNLPPPTSPPRAEEEMEQEEGHMAINVDSSSETSSTEGEAED